MVGSTSLWPSLLATWLSLAPVPPAGQGPGAGNLPLSPPPGISQPAGRGHAPAGRD